MGGGLFDSIFLGVLKRKNNGGKQPKPEYQSVFQQLTTAGTEGQDGVSWGCIPNDITEDPRFDNLIGLVIVSNAIAIGLEVDNGHGDQLHERVTYFLLELVFNTIFVGEMIMRQRYLGWNYFLDPWNVLDYFLVMIGVIDILVSLLYSNVQVDMKTMQAFRMVRMLRIVRNLKLLRAYRELYLIVQGFYDSIPTLFWVSVLLCLGCYITAVYFVMVLGHDLGVTEYWPHVDQYVGTVPRAMFSMFQVVTLDSWTTEIARPILERNFLSLLVFTFILITCSFGVLNVIVGVIVERTITVAMENEEEVHKEIEKAENLVIDSFADEFKMADSDCSSEIDHKEFKSLFKQPSFIRKLRLLEVEKSEASGLFDLMDIDRSGQISAEEFIEGIQRLRGAARSKDLVQLKSSLQRHLTRSVRISDRIDRLNVKIDRCLDRLDIMSNQTDVELESQSKAKVRSKEIEEVGKKRKLVLSHITKNAMMRFPPLGEDGS